MMCDSDLEAMAEEIRTADRERILKAMDDDAFVDEMAAKYGRDPLAYDHAEYDARMEALWQKNRIRPTVQAQQDARESVDAAGLAGMKRAFEILGFSKLIEQAPIVEVALTNKRDPLASTLVQRLESQVKQLQRERDAFEREAGIWKEAINELCQPGLWTFSTVKSSEEAAAIQTATTQRTLAQAKIDLVCAACGQGLEAGAVHNICGHLLHYSCSAEFFRSDDEVTQ